MWTTSPCKRKRKRESRYSNLLFAPFTCSWPQLGAIWAWTSPSWRYLGADLRPRSASKCELFSSTGRTWASKVLSKLALLKLCLQDPSGGSRSENKFSHWFLRLHFHIDSPGVQIQIHILVGLFQMTFFSKGITARHNSSSYTPTSRRIQSKASNEKYPKTEMVNLIHEIGEVVACLQWCSHLRGIHGCILGHVPGVFPFEETNAILLNMALSLLFSYPRVRWGLTNTWFL